MKMTSKLDLALRKQKGIVFKKKYVSLFDSFSFSRHIELEESDIILKNLKNKSEGYKRIDEIIPSTSKVNDSKLLNNIVIGLQHEEQSYLFTDEYEFCGMYLVESKEGFSKVFELAKNSLNNTCFILDKELNFGFRINYYDQNHNDFPRSIDIQQIL